MPRQARLDAPGILHHVMVRGLERRPIFRDDVDRRDFCTRLGGLVEATNRVRVGSAPEQRVPPAPDGPAAPGSVYACASHRIRRGLQPATQACRAPFPESLTWASSGVPGRRLGAQSRGLAAGQLLGVRPSAVYRAAHHGRTARGRWESVLTVGETKKNFRKQRPL